MCCLDVWWNQEGLEWPTDKFPSPLCPHEQSPYPNNPCYQGDYAECLTIPAWQVLVSHWPAELFQQLNSILPREPGVTSSSWYYKACFPQPLVVHAVSEERSHVPCMAFLSSASSYESMWLVSCCWSHLSSVVCLAIPKPLVQDPSFISEENRKWLKPVL